MSKRGGLGRGLSALIPGAPEAGEGSGLLEVPVNAVSPNPKQPRTRFDDEAIASLAASIREVGILQPIVVRKAGAGYELIAGERRLRAAKLAGLATIPVVVRDTDDADTLREALIENIHREDLGPIELAEAFRQLLEELGLKQEELAERVGVSRSHIANTIRLLQLPLDVQQLLTDGKTQAGHARALLDARRRGGAEHAGAADRGRGPDRARGGGPGQALRGGPPPGGAGRPSPRTRRRPTPRWPRSRRSCRSSSRPGSQIQMGKKRGRVVIEFGSADDLDRIVSEIIGSGPGLAPD